MSGYCSRERGKKNAYTILCGNLEGGKNHLGDLGEERTQYLMHIKGKMDNFRLHSFDSS
jgi:hypothetical protein